MQRLERFLKYQAHGKMIFLWMFACLGFQFLYMMTVLRMYSMIIPLPPAGSGGPASFPPIYVLIVSAVGEEIVYRFIPIFMAAAVAVLVQHFAPARIAKTVPQWRLKWIISVAIVASIFFGLAHGSPANIPTQGVAGFMWCILFLKCGGNHDRFLKATAVSSTAHFLYNWTIITMALLAGL